MDTFIADPSIREDKQESSKLLYPPTSISTFGESSYTLPVEEDENFLERITSTYFDFIVDRELFERVKFYENKFKLSSDEFYSQWKCGAISSTPETNDWASISRQLNLVK